MDELELHQLKEEIITIIEASITGKKIKGLEKYHIIGTQALKTVLFILVHIKSIHDKELIEAIDRLSQFLVNERPGQYPEIISLCQVIIKKENR